MPTEPTKPIEPTSRAPSLVAAAVSALLATVVVYAGLKSAERVLGADMPRELAAALPKIGMFRRLVVGVVVGVVLAPVAAFAARRDAAATFGALGWFVVVAAFAGVLQSVLVP